MNSREAFMDNKLCDLHIHSTFSDGSYTPSEIVSIGKEKGLFALALTDHNNINGLSEFRAACEKEGILYSTATELTTEYEGEEIHLVSHFLPEESYPEMTRYLENRNRLKEDANRECIERLQKAGYDVSYEEFLEFQPTGPRNRAHIARYLTEKSITESIGKAFGTLLIEDGLYYVSAPRLPLFDAIEKVRSLHGTPVVAHPLLNISPGMIDRFLTECIDHGLVGMETHYTLFDEDETKFLEEKAKAFHLLESGGSDFHGLYKKGIQLGSGHGDLKVPIEFFYGLKEKSKEM